MSNLLVTLGTVFQRGAGGAGRLAIKRLQSGPYGQEVEPDQFQASPLPGSLILQAVRWYFRFTLSIRDVEELMAERGIEVSREAIRCWVIQFGPLVAANLRRARSRPTGRWHLDEVVVKIGGRRMYLSRAVDDEGEVLDVLGQKRRSKHAALKLLRRLLRNSGVHPEAIVTEKAGFIPDGDEDVGPSGASPLRRDEG